MPDIKIPDLTFSMVDYGTNETPFDLRVLLYKGSAKADLRGVFNQIAAGKFGKPIAQRIDLVVSIHEAMKAKLVARGAKISASTTLRALRSFFGWADESGNPLSMETVEATFRLWCDYLRYRVQLRKMKERSAYSLAAQASSILNAALDRSQPLILTTRLRKGVQGIRAVGVAADKQNMAETFEFGRLCLSVIDSLPVTAIFGPLPVRIKLNEDCFVESWSRLRDPASVKCLQPGYKNKANLTKAQQKRADWELDHSLRTRYPLVNLRVMAEMLVFIAQTGMNLSQAHKLRRTQFSYKSNIDGYQVRDYKHRRSGEVLFEIFAAYRKHFERYLAWLDSVFSNEPVDYLFPFVRQGGGLESTPPSFNRFRLDICKPARISFVGPQKLRKTRMNWLLRQSRNHGLTAEQLQNTQQTLLRVYEMPSLQVAQTEIIQFWMKNDPRLSSNPMQCPAPGDCDGVSKPKANLPIEAPKPDCVQPAGCLFCENHRDIDRADYVWSVASMRFLNTIILQKFPPAAKNNADAARHVELVIDLLTAKLNWFNESNVVRKAWVKEAVEKLAEGDFHIYWRYLIESAEGV